MCVCDFRIVLFTNVTSYKKLHINACSFLYIQNYFFFHYNIYNIQSFKNLNQSKQYMIRMIPFSTFARNCP